MKQHHQHPQSPTIMAASGHNKYGPGYNQVRHHEWRTAENSSNHLLPKLLSMAKDNPNLKLLDVGAGSGTISTSLARYIPDGHVTATDISDEILVRAKEFADSQGVTNIEFKRADVFELPFSDSTFDVTHAHQVLCHLDTPTEAIQEMIRVTKPGGVVSLRESDMHMWCFWPEIPGLLKFHENQIRVLVANGGQDKGGRQLVSWALKAGVARQDITASFGTWCYSDPEDRRVWAGSMRERLIGGHTRRKSLELGISTESELDEMAQAWQDWADTDDATFGLVNGQVLIEKK